MRLSFQSVNGQILINHKDNYIFGAGAFLILLACTAGFGWYFDIPILTTIFKGWPSLKINTAFLFLLTGLSMVFLRNRNNHLRVALAVGIIFISILTLLQFEFTTLEPINNILLFNRVNEFKSSGNPGSMSELTAMSFLISGVIFLFLDQKKILKLTAEILLALVAFIAILAIVSYITSLPFQDRPFFSTMAIHTAVGFLVFSLFTSLFNKHLGFSALLFSHRNGYVIARKFFLRLVASALLSLFLVLFFMQRNSFSSEFAVVLFAVLLSFIFIPMLIQFGAFLNRSDLKGETKEKELETIRNFLNGSPTPLIILKSDGSVYEKNNAAGTFLENSRDRTFFETFPRIKDAISERGGDEKLEIEASELKYTRVDNTDGTLIYSLREVEISKESYFVISISDVTELNKLKKSVRQFSEKLSLATAISKTGIFEINIENGEMNCDANMCHLHGVESGIPSKDMESWLQKIHPDDRDIFRKELEKAISSKETVEFTYRLDNDSIDTQYLKLNAQLIDSSLIGTCIDLTEEKKAEIELKNAFEQTQIFVSQAPSAIAMFDKNMRYIAVSEMWKADYGISETNILGKSHYEIFPEIGDDWKKIHAECLAGAINRCDEAEFEREDETKQWISWDVRPWRKSNGEIGGIIMNTANLTPLKESQQEKINLAERLNETNNIARIGDWEVNLKDKTVYWSDLTKEIHEVSPDYVPTLDEGINFYKPGLSRDKIRSAVQNAIENGESWDLELELVTAKGNTIWVRAIGQCEQNKGVATRLFGIFQDINELKVAELELNSMLKISEDQNDRLKNYAHIVSHNLRSHSGNIGMMIDLFLEVHPYLKNEETITMLSEASKNLKETINELNQVVLMTNPTKENLITINLNPEIDNIIEQLKLQASNLNVSVINNLPEEFLILGLRAYVESVFHNLISNGIKYSRKDAESFIKISGHSNQGKAEIVIQDNGLGIDLSKHANKVFGMYKTFHGNKDAKGIGLFITKNQVESMGGTIDIESTPDVGTKFTIRLSIPE